MIWMEYVDDFIAQIKDGLPPDHEIQQHEIFPGIKWEGRPIFIVDDDTTGEEIWDVLNISTCQRESSGMLTKNTTYIERVAVFVNVPIEFMVELK